MSFFGASVGFKGYGNKFTPERMNRILRAGSQDKATKMGLFDSTLDYLGVYKFFTGQSKKAEIRRLFNELRNGENPQSSTSECLQINRFLKLARLADTDSQKYFTINKCLSNSKEADGLSTDSYKRYSRDGIVYFPPLYNATEKDQLKFCIDNQVIATGLASSPEAKSLLGKITDSTKSKAGAYEIMKFKQCELSKTATVVKYEKHLESFSGQAGIDEYEKLQGLNQIELNSVKIAEIARDTVPQPNNSDDENDTRTLAFTAKQSQDMVDAFHRLFEKISENGRDIYRIKYNYAINDLLVVMAGYQMNTMYHSTLIAAGTNFIDGKMLNYNDTIARSYEIKDECLVLTSRYNTNMIDTYDGASEELGCTVIEDTFSLDFDSSDRSKFVLKLTTCNVMYSSVRVKAE